MRCYFMRGERIDGIAPLRAGTDDELIAQAARLFQGKETQFDAFEVWDRERFVFRSAGAETSTPAE